MKTEYDFSQGKRGAIVPQTGKTRITIYIDDDVLETFRQLGDAAGKGYQTTMNEALRQYLDKAKTPIAPRPATHGSEVASDQTCPQVAAKAIDEETLRRVIQEELRAVK
jgi:BrnA antitoxin of type II toxin-antitoxin system